MNRITGAAMMIVAIFGTGTASANDGILFRNTSDPYFTTPAEFVALAKTKTGTQEVDRAVPGASRIPQRDQNDPARGGLTGR
ncbi:MAG: hypothetical protein FD175_2754 [Beijerinckiaceae bacterium]|nr:MAG: hypothetical protein FD175_2754 [Beijerinckiaceae bacterium]